MSFKNAKRNTVIVTAIIVVSKLIGMLRDVVLANYYGTTNVSDAYIIASTVPTLLFYFVGHALSTAFLPIYNKVKQEKGEDLALRYMNNLLFCSFIICFLFACLLIFFPEVVAKIFATGFDEQTIKLSANLIRTCAVSLFFMVIINIWSGYLHAKENFVVPAAISLPRNAVIIVSIAISATVGVEFLGVGLLLAYVAEFVFLLPSVIKAGYRLKFRLRFNDEEMKQTYKMVLPIIIGVGVSQINKIIDRSVASTIIIGGVSALSYASVINSAVQEIFVSSIVTILFADCARLVAEGRSDGAKNKLQKTLNLLILLLIPAMIGVVVLAEPIVSIIFSRGQFDNESVLMTSGALRLYTLGMLFVAIRDTIVKVFYAYKDTKITTILSIVSILINIILNIVLGIFMGINGLALATAISAIFNACSLYVCLYKKIGNFGIKNNIFCFATSLVSASIMGGVVYLIYGMLIKIINSSLLVLILATLVGVIVYFSIISILNYKKVLSFLKKTKENRRV